MKLTLPEPYSPFLDNLTFPILPSHMFSGVRSVDIKLHPANLRAVGSGPFRLNNLLLNDDNKLTEIVLDINPFYHGETSMLSGIKIRYFSNENLAVQALEQGEIMGIGGLRTNSLESIIVNEAFNVHTSVLPNTKIIFLNQQNESLKFFKGVINLENLSALSHAVIKSLYCLSNPNS